MPPVYGRETILLVEDEPAILRVTTRMLEGLGYIVLAAATPTEAMRQVEEYPAAIHLLLTDVVMPEMSGSELAKNLLSRLPHLRHLFMSGFPADSTGRRGVLEELFLQKPFSKSDLATRVREALGAPPAVVR